MESARIMIVEDEGIVAKDLQHMLDGLGYFVSATVSSGEAAIQKATILQPDLVLVGVVLKGDMNGQVTKN